MAENGVSEIFDPTAWREVPGFEDLEDLTYHRAVEHGTVRIAFDRPEVRNAFRPGTVDELLRVLEHARIVQRRRLRDPHRQRPVAPRTAAGRSAPAATSGSGAAPATSTPRATTADTVDKAQARPAAHPRVPAADPLHAQGRASAWCPGWAAGGGHSLHVVSDLTLASREHARFKQTDADVGSFDGGFGSAYLARQVGQKFAREIFFLGDEYTAEDAHRMGMVNRVVDHADLEREALEWGRKINGKSPTAQRMLKYSFNLIDDGLVGQQLFAGETTRLAYMTDEAVEGRDSFLEKREPDWSPFPWSLTRVRE